MFLVLVGGVVIFGLGWFIWNVVKEVNEIVSEIVLDVEIYIKMEFIKEGLVVVVMKIDMVILVFGEFFS